MLHPLRRHTSSEALAVLLVQVASEKGAVLDDEGESDSASEAACWGYRRLIVMYPSPKLQELSFK